MFYDSVDAHPPNFKIDFGSPSLLATVNTILHYQQNKVHQITELVCPNRNSFLLSSDELHRNETGASIAFKNFKKLKRVMLTGPLLFPRTANCNVDAFYNKIKIYPSFNEHTISKPLSFALL